MDKYKVRLNQQAFREIDDIFSYIALEKLSPENAKGQTDRIWAALKKLETFPQSHQERSEGRYAGKGYRSEEHTSELQSRFDLVCRLLLEKKKKKKPSEVLCM